MAGSRWVKLDTSYPTNPKVFPLSDSAFRVHVAMIAWSAHQLTDGKIARAMSPAVLDSARVARRARARVMSELVTAGLLIETAAGWEIHGFADMNPQAMRDVVERDRERWRTRQARRRSDVTGGHSRESPGRDETRRDEWSARGDR